MGIYLLDLVVFTHFGHYPIHCHYERCRRVSEVAARFTLDAMPGKQMSIDADLNAGMISEQEARERREKVVGKPIFMGQWTGQRKFVKGDAIAGIIIVIINLIIWNYYRMIQQGFHLQKQHTHFHY